MYVFVYTLSIIYIDCNIQQELARGKICVSVNCELLLFEFVIGAPFLFWFLLSRRKNLLFRALFI